MTGKLGMYLTLSREMERLKTINSESDDEDKIADAGNDYLEISSLFDNLSSNAVSLFGEQILNFSRDEA
ncbi:hypothetical protein ACR30L_06325 [Psychromonas sp. PT13]|uniref:hypothetical protein n=1 Tax=Psychromonas sp. PT13 TaxID=3439547 RepID=UPI003EB6C12C